MTYVTYITIGNRPLALRDWLVSHFSITKDQAQSIVDSEPYKPTSREDQYQWVQRVTVKAKSLKDS